ncbi:MAG: penicillin-binding protein 2, partial [Candidatus Latescibacteria bacterium]|nr:penicillin-binding protein 2 [Candidatus Latescibacterota bacterium]
MNSGITNHRLSFISVIGFVLWGGLGLRLGFVQVYDRDLYLQRAHDQQRRITTLTPNRGRIFDRNLEPLALNVEFESFGLNRLGLSVTEEQLGRFVVQVAQITDQDPDLLIDHLLDTPGFTYIARDVNEDISKRIQSLPLYEQFKSHIQIEKKTRRVYPHRSIAGQILGFSVDGIGRAGLEMKYNQLLKGVEGYAVMQIDATGRKYSRVESDYRPALHGTDVMLTIDVAYQAIAEEVLEDTVRRHKALGGMIIVMEPMTGEILAMASAPDFDPNTPSYYAYETQKMRPLVDIYEPGSTFKLVTAAAVLETDIYDLDDVIVTNNGTITVGTQTITDSEVFEALTVQDVIVHSSNVGTIKMAQKLGKISLFEYSRKFGFGIKTDIELPGEARGILHKPVDWSVTTLPTMAIGYGVSVTGLQLVSAYCVVANNGLLMAPQIIKTLIHADGTVQDKPSTGVRKVISERTAALLRQVFTGVVDHGTGRAAAVPGYNVAGKTGTAWKAREGAPGYTKDYRSSFVGMFPADNPEIVALIMIDEPTEGGFYGGSVAAPAFRKMVERMIHLPGRPIKMPPNSDDGRPLYLATLRNQQKQKIDDEAPSILESPPKIEGGVLPLRNLEISGEPVQRKEGTGLSIPTVVGLSLRKAIQKLA